MENIQQLLSIHPEFQEQLFIRGFLMTNAALPPAEQFPFYGQFSETAVRGYRIRVHKKQTIVTAAQAQAAFVLIGHCVNPFTGSLSEQEIIDRIAEFGTIDCPDAISYINELTGNFFLAEIHNTGIRMLTDPAGMLFSCYGRIGGAFYISSHAQLIADVAPVTKDAYIVRLERYRFFYKYGLFFPGDLTQYSELKRLLQNHITSFDGEKVSVKRFYPDRALPQTDTEQAYQALLQDVVKLMHNTLACYAKKYKKPAISLTGGMDSKLTLACANGLYDAFRYYSYITMEGDRIDADAAHTIAGSMGLHHDIYQVSENDADFDNIDVVRAVLEHNNGGYRVNANDVRKREYFRKLCGGETGFDAEVKSWVSEIARSNYYKKFGLRKLPEHLSPRNMTSMYKVFLTERRLCRETGSIFRDFIEKTGFHHFPEGFDESDLYLWEFRYSAWGGIVITSEHSFSNEILIPYNNRLLLNRMLQAPKKKRITDEFHEDLIRTANEAVAKPGITITNWNETKTRMRMERFYFLVNSKLPF